MSGCMGSSSNQEALTSPVESSPTETGTTTVSAPPVPPPLTHRQFIHTLDHLCKVGNNLLDKKFGGDVTVSDTAESMDAYARFIERADRFNDKFNRKNNFFGLDPALEKDQRDYAKYRELSRRLDNYSAREIRAARRHDFEELLRLFALDKKARNQRTKVTADMGLRFCGA
jgi:hypothetical protein